MQLPPEAELSQALYSFTRRVHADDPLLRLAALMGAAARTVLEFPPDERPEILEHTAKDFPMMVEIMAQRGIGGAAE